MGREEGEGEAAGGPVIGLTQSWLLEQAGHLPRLTIVLSHSALVSATIVNM